MIVKETGRAARENKARKEEENVVRKVLAIVLIVLGVANVALGATFTGLGAVKRAYVQDAMDKERITLTLSEEQVAAGELVDTAAEAQAAGDLVREHRHEMGTYDEILGGGRFNPENPQHLVYGQALNLENYLYLAVASFGLTLVAIGAGVSMLVTGIGFVILGAWALSRRRGQPAEES